MKRLLVGVWGDVRPGVTAGIQPDVRPAECLAGRPAGRSPVSSAAPKKKHLIEAAPFGRLDQMLWTTVEGAEGPGGLCPSSQNRGFWGAAPPSQKRKILNYQETVFLKKLYQEKQLTVC